MVTTKTQNLRRFSPYLLLILGIILGAYAFMHQKLPQQPGPANASAPSENKPAPAEVDSYSVSPDLPKYLEIPKLKIEKSRVMGLGVDKNHRILVPNNIYDVGWYNDSKKPGQNGAMFMYGHVSGWRANGVFFNLSKLQPGDTINVTRGDKKVFSYRVETFRRFPAKEVDMQSVLSPISKNSQGLNLMTCAGKMDSKTGEFEERLVVYSTLVSGSN